ncbi:tetratricopeptide repeat protein [Fluviicoccus keumensis]|uniref:Tetratricopeptide repeat protein n=1 Tax=Fluviicoccus keumensis TaxID=1435465 RepID=A0A4Q7YKL2_9GAMM|nr:tetratricopeptide repeat protein [Fluviicoccus keumensis]
MRSRFLIFKERNTHVSTANTPPSKSTAYLLWFFLGGLGAHRFYTGRKGSGIAMMLLGLSSAGAQGKIILISLPLALWWFVDAFLIPGMVRDAAANVEEVDPGINPDDVAEIQRLRDQYQGAAEHGDTSGALMASLKLLGLLEQVYGQESVDVAEVLFDRAELLRRQGRLSEALSTAERTLAILRNAGNRLGEAACLNMLGELHAGLKHQVEALACHEAGLALLAGDPAAKGSALYVHLLNNLAVLHDRDDRPDQALGLLEQASALLGKLPADEAGLKATVLCTHANVLRDLKRFEQADGYYERALLLARKAPANAVALEADFRDERAQMYRMMGRMDEAEQELAQAKSLRGGLHVVREDDAAPTPAVAPGPVLNESGMIEFSGSAAKKTAD